MDEERYSVKLSIREHENGAEMVPRDNYRLCLEINGVEFYPDISKYGLWMAEDKAIELKDKVVPTLENKFNLEVE